jgi:hypothetical protein
LLAEQVRADTCHGVTSNSTHSKEEMGENFYGIHYRYSSSASGDYIFVVVERMKTLAHLFSIPTSYKAIHVVELFFREVFWLHCLIRKIVNDRDGCFIGAYWQEHFQLVGIELATSTSYHLLSHNLYFPKAKGKWILNWCNKEDDLSLSP